MVRCFKLYNNVLIPAIGYGTWSIKQAEPIKAALDAGYRHIDTADCYHNQSIIGDTIKSYPIEDIEDQDDSPTLHPDIVNVDNDTFTKSFSVPTGRKQHDRPIFITGKVPPQRMSKEGVKETVDDFLDQVKRSRVDLMLLHWPGASKMNPQDSRHRKARLEAWKALEKEYANGRCRSIGVSNFLATHLQDLLEDIQTRGTDGVIPMVNQIEISPLCQPPEDLLRICVKYKIRLAAYSPLGSPDGIKEVLANCECGPETALRWALSKGFIVLPRSKMASHIKANKVIENLELTEADKIKFAKIDKLGQESEPKRYCWDPNDVL